MTQRISRRPGRTATIATLGRYGFIVLCCGIGLNAAASGSAADTQETPDAPETTALQEIPSTQEILDVRGLTLDVASARQALASAQLSSVDLAQLYLQRIAQLDRQGPQLHALLELNPAVLEEARQLDAERRAGQLRSPLHGLPVVVKANIASADTLATSAGSLALAQYHAPRDATVLAQLRAAGLLLLGKTNLSEWSNFRSPHSSSGWSSLGGQTRNPYVLNRSPCGSSSGSAVAVSAGLSLLAVGTETNGSITCPAAMTGVAGIKPTWGAVDGSGIIPIARSQDVAGPLARSVSDAAALLEQMLSAQGREHFPAGLVPAGDTAALRGARIGWVSHYNAEHPEIAELMQQVVTAARTAGAEMVEVPRWQLKDEIYDDAYFTLLYEFKHDFNAWLDEMHQVDGQFPGGLSQLADLIQFNEQHRAQVMPIFAQEYLYAAQALDLDEEAANGHHARQRSRDSSRQLIDQTLRAQQLEAILLPAGGAAWLIDHVQGDRYAFGTSSAAALAGYPSVTFPAGWQDELPLGLSLIASAWSEPRLISLAAALEQRLAARRPPRFIPSLEQRYSTPTVP